MHEWISDFGETNWSGNARHLLLAVQVIVQSAQGEFGLLMLAATTVAAAVIIAKGISRLRGTHTSPKSIGLAMVLGPTIAFFGMGPYYAGVGIGAGVAFAIIYALFHVAFKARPTSSLDPQQDLRSAADPFLDAAALDDNDYQKASRLPLGAAIVGAVDEEFEELGKVMIGVFTTRLAGKSVLSEDPTSVSRACIEEISEQLQGDGLKEIKAAISGRLSDWERVPASACIGAPLAGFPAGGGSAATW